MDFFDLEIFLETAKTLNFSEVARNIPITQSALSQRIKTLEEKLGYQLFVRRRGLRSMDLTEKGRKFLIYATMILREWDTAKDIGKETISARIFVSLAETVQTCLFPDIISDFNREHEDIHVYGSNLYSLEASDNINSGILDFAIVGRRNYCRNGFIEPVYSEPWVLVFAPDSKMPERVHPGNLIPDNQVMLCSIWMTEWQEYWFPKNIEIKSYRYPVAFLNAPPVIEKEWSLLPYSVARYCRNKFNCKLSECEEAPQNRVIYSLISDNDNIENSKVFLEYVRDRCKKIEGLNLI